MKKKLIAITLTALITIGTLAGCKTASGNTSNNNTTGTVSAAADNNAQNVAGNSEQNTEKQAPANSGTNTSDIGSDEASRIALEAAGFTEADVTNLRVAADYDDGRAVYDVDFWKDNTEYDYEILASTGEIVSFDQETKKNPSGQNGTPNSQDGKNNKQNDQAGQSSTQISLEDAKKLALDRVPGATEQNMKIELDYDDGYYLYEGEIIYDQKEYDFEIDANTGTFLEWSEERW